MGTYDFDTGPICWAPDRGRMIMEPTTFAAIASTVKTALGLAKGVGEDEIRIPLREAILDLQGRVLELQAEIGELREENRALIEKAALSEMEFRDDGMYWDDDEGPFCPHCVPNGVRARVSTNPSNRYLICNVCGNQPVSDPARNRGY